MSEYQLEIKQVVDYPRFRIYRQFIQNLMADRSIRTGGGSDLFYYTVLCNYANFRTSYLRIDGIGYTVYPGEWICTVKELSAWFRTPFPVPGSFHPGRTAETPPYLLSLSGPWKGGQIQNP